MVRGVDRRDIFIDDRDRLDLLGRLSHILPESGCRCFAWVLMSNHIHLVTRTGEVPIGRAMARIGTGYAGYFNRRHGRVGHLVQNRFKSRLVASDTELKNLIRYVHLNPVAAGIVRSLAALEQFPWSGHSALAGGRPQRFHQHADTLALFGTNRGAARAALESFMRDGISRRTDEHAEGAKAHLHRIISDVCRCLGIAPSELTSGRRDRTVSDARRAIIERATRETRVSKRAIATAIGCSPPAVHYWLLRTGDLSDR